ncbi:MAG: Mrp/NBP35 family ATP-binding protein [Armatimonadetes bacterium]|nr:Mrp/NBP35 family ATP-binding protein [Armatimonadota bacterium]
MATTVEQKRTTDDHEVAEDDVLNALRRIIDPDLHRDIVQLGFVKHLRVCGGGVAFDIELTTPACPVKAQMESQAREFVGALPGVSQVNVTMTSQVRSHFTEDREYLASVKNVIAVASGKGGVGKSTVAANLALALAKTGAAVGLMDADVYGPSVPIMMGVSERPEVSVDQKILPLENHGLKLMSIGFLADDRAPIIWRGPMVGKLLQQFMSDVAWGDLDYLVMDLPPGTGDAQLTLCQTATLSGAVIVTTPQEVALEDVTRAIRMFEKVNVPVLGIVENMSYYVCSHCGHREEVFLHGGGQRAAETLGVPFLGEIPLDPQICLGGDNGVPIVAGNPESPQTAAFFEIAGRVAASLSTLAMEESQGGGDSRGEPLLRIVS